MKNTCTYYVKDLMGEDQTLMTMDEFIQKYQIKTNFWNIMVFLLQYKMINDVAIQTTLKQALKS